MGMKAITFLAVLSTGSLAVPRRHYCESPFGEWKEYDSGYHVQRMTDTGRVEVMEKTLTKSYLDTGTFLTETVMKGTKKLPGDVIGALLNRKLGGIGDETFNAIPMNPSTDEIWRSKVIEPVYDYLLKDGSQKLLFVVMPIYDGLETDRPNGFGVYVTVGVLSNVHLVKGYVPNPTESKIPGGLVPYLCSTGREKSIRIRGTTYNTLQVRGNKLRSWRVRVEKAQKVICFDSLNSGTGIDEINAAHALKLSSNDADVPGQLISQKLGGEGDDPYNVVPMTPKALDAFKTQVERPIAAFLCQPSNKDKSVMLTVFVVYASEVSTRPSGFISISKGSNSDFKIFIPN